MFDGVDAIGVGGAISIAEFFSYLSGERAVFCFREFCGAYGAGVSPECSAHAADEWDIALVCRLDECQFGRERIDSVDDQVDLSGEYLVECFGMSEAFEGIDYAVGVDIAYAIASDLDFRQSHRTFECVELSVDISSLYAIEIDESESTDACASESFNGVAANRSESDDEYK